jgi:uncharacterized protein YegL
MSNHPSFEFVNNPQQRCPVVLLLDTSLSMKRNNSIKELNDGVKLFKEEVCKDQDASVRLDLAIITFGDKPKVVQQFVNIDSFIPPTLVAKGETPMGEAIDMALELLKNRRDQYNTNKIESYHPWIFMISDGEPNDEWREAAKRAKQLVKDGHLVFYVIGVGDANFKILNQIASDSTPAYSMAETEFKELFVWLSNSIKEVAHSTIEKQLKAPRLEFRHKPKE